MKPWWLLLLSGPAFAYNYLWEFTGSVDRFEMKLDAGPYVSVGLPPVASGTWTLPGDPTLTGTHSAVVRACVAAACSPDSNILVFTVAPAPKPAAPANVRLIALAGPVESPNLTKVTLPNIGSITDTKGDVWSLGPKDPLVQGGVEYVLLRNNNRTFPPPQAPSSIGVLFLCYKDHAVIAFSTSSWYQWTGTFMQNIWPTIPAGC